MKCPNCNADLPDHVGVFRCPHCGAEIPLFTSSGKKQRIPNEVWFLIGGGLLFAMAYLINAR